jgi:hypothetical protein
MQPSRCLRMIILFGLSAALSGCGSAVQPASPSSVPGQPSPGASSTASATIAPPPALTLSPTPEPRLDTDPLPRVDLTKETPTAVCDPEPSQANADAGESTIACGEALTLAARTVRSVSTASIERLWVRRPVCTSFPCTEDQLNTASVVVQTTAEALVVDIDGRLTSVSTPRPAPPPLWPAAGSSAVPAAAKPWITGAPAEVKKRNALPYCGRTEVSSPRAIMDCFRDAVLSGRPAEVVDLSYGTEGGEYLQVYRFSGTGPIVGYSHFDRWIKQVGSLHLNPDDLGWSFDAWDGGTTLP